MTWPEQRDPGAGRASVAPYNFVPLPAAIRKHPEGLAHLRRLHAVYDPDRLTGYIELQIQAKTPLYTRCAYPPEHAKKTVLEEKYRWQFFHHGDHAVPVLPGSSIRGMIRTLVEILADAKIARVADRQLFYRFIGVTGTGPDYVGRMVEQQRVRGRPRYKPKVQAGFLRRGPNGAYVETCEYARILASDLTPRPYQDRPHPNDIPPPCLQGASVTVTVDDPDWHDSSRIRMWYRRARIARPGDPGARQGVLVITGPAMRKHREFVFLPSPNPQTRPVPEALMAELESPRQITQWQEAAFPAGGGRTKAGGFADGEPVFFLEENGEIVGFGRAQLFRLQYRKSTAEFVPNTLRASYELDLAEGIFGRVGDKPETTLKGRVSFEDAVWQPRSKDEDPFLCAESQRKVLRILSSPKPSSYQHYLIQTDDATLAHYDDPTPDRTVIRGHKLYWHKRGQPPGRIFEQDGTDPGKQRTVVRPVGEKTSFAGRIHFENLSHVELGALLAAIDIGETRRHKLGMGKPLGMGTVKLIHRLQLIDRAKRYAAMQATGEEPYPSEKVAAEEKKARQAFQKFVGADGLAPIWVAPRLKALAHLLEWNEAPPVRRTRYVYVDDDRLHARADGDLDHREEPIDRSGQWKYRCVLPTPETVREGADPCRPERPERPDRPSHREVPAHDRQRSPRAPAAVDPSQQKAANTIIKKHPKAESKAPGAPRQPERAEKRGIRAVYRQGQRVKGTVVQSHGHRYTFRLEDGSEHVVVRPYFNRAIGDVVKLRVIRVDAQGRIKELGI